MEVLPCPPFSCSSHFFLDWAPADVPVSAAAACQERWHTDSRFPRISPCPGRQDHVQWPWAPQAPPAAPPDRIGHDELALWPTGSKGPSPRTTPSLQRGKEELLCSDASHSPGALSWCSLLAADKMAWERQWKNYLKYKGPSPAAVLKSLLHPAFAAACSPRWGVGYVSHVHLQMPSISKPN